MKNFAEGIKTAEGDKNEEGGITRREFLGRMAVGAGAFLATGFVNPEKAAAFLEKIAGVDEKKEEGEPKISFEIVYGYHRTAEDIKDLPEKINQADVFMPEFFSWTKDDIAIFNKVSSGKITTEQALRGFGLSAQVYPKQYACYQLIFKSLENTKKKVEIVDVPRLHPLDKKMDEVLSNYYNNVCRFDKDVRLDKTFEEDLIAFRKFHEGCAEVNIGRGKCMLRNIKKFAADARVHPEKYENNNIDGIKILLFLGAIHTDVYHFLKKSEEKTSRYLQNMPYVFGGYEEDLMRGFLFKKEADQTLISRAFLERFMQENAIFGLFKLSDDTRLIKLWMRKVVSTFDYDELKKLFDSVRSVGGDIATFQAAFTKALKEKNFSIPKSEAELKSEANVSRGMP